MIDPRALTSVTHSTWRVVFRAPTATEADALSTALLAMGAQRAKAWFRRAEGRGRCALVW